MDKEKRRREGVKGRGVEWNEPILEQSEYRRTEYVSIRQRVRMGDGKFDMKRKEPWRIDRTRRINRQLSTRKE